MVKHCKTCGEDKPVTMFAKDARGYPRSRCIACYNFVRRIKPKREFWTDEQDAILTREYPTGGWEAVAKLTGRDNRSIRNRASKLGVHMVRPDHYETPLRKGQEPPFGIPADDRTDDIKALDCALRNFREVEPGNLTWIIGAAA